MVTERRKHDQYFSQSWIVDILTARKAFNKTHDVVEPCKGDGAISERLRSLGYQVRTADIDETKGGNYPGLDFFEPRAEKIFNGCDWIVTNPPYFCAPDFVRVAMSRANLGVACFLRLSFLEPCEKKDTSKRLDLLSPRADRMRLWRVIVCPRISFTNDGGKDNMTCAWFVWVHDGATASRPELEFISDAEVQAACGQASLF